MDQSRRCVRKSTSAAHAIFGRHVFRKSVGYADRTPINRGLFEAQMVVLSGLSDSKIAGLIERPEQAAAALRAALRYGSTLSNALLYATGSGDASNTRIAEMTGVFKEAMDA